MSEPTSNEMFRKLFADAIDVANDLNGQLYEQRNSGGTVTLDWGFVSRVCMMFSYCAGYAAGTEARERP